MAISRPAHSLPVRIYSYGLAGLLTLASVAGMAGILMSMTVQEDGAALRGENRRLGALPAIPHTAEEWNSFPRRFEAFVNDHFGLRTALVRTHTDISTALLNRLPTDQVVAGKDGWLFYAGEGALGLFQRAVSLDLDRLDAWRDQLSQRATALSARGVPYAFVIAPDKHTIYGENMPGYLRQGRNPSPHDQLVATATAHGLPVVDLRPDLTAAKTDARLYMRDDTHWNERGADVAYRTLMQHLGLQPLTLDADSFAMRPNGPGDLASMALIDRLEDVPSLRPEALPCVAKEVERVADQYGRAVISRTRCDGATGKLLFFRDSFGDALLPFLTASFGEVVAVADAPSTQDFLHMVKTELPDVVIEERVERHLRFPPRAIKAAATDE
ncbi:lysophospholipase L1-like esterase [Pseudochelatococcus contaminans]|uniref:Lysophospholipase L1-like esterase n=1 Tax=Pseudochelatococcus contaminans TaxID=1538103 RepID=A0A7W5Z3L3_9HYPH|nr:lysophospholipase L1-like esterase [Pseudochelatococcus contaminans]